MLKWIAKKYLIKQYKFWNYQVLSLDTEIHYIKNVNLTKEQETDLLIAHEEAILNRDSVGTVLRDLFNVQKIKDVI